MPPNNVANKPQRVNTNTKPRTQQNKTNQQQQQSTKITNGKQTKTNNTEQPPARKTKAQRNNQRQAMQNGQKPKQQQARKAPVATGPNYTESGNNRYKIGKEFDARNHMGWRKVTGNVGSSIQFLYIPKMVNRADQAYYRRQHTDDEGFIQTFAVGVFVQDSTLPRNVLRDPKLFKAGEKEIYLENLSKAFDSLLKRTQQALATDAPPPLHADAD